MALVDDLKAADAQIQAAVQNAIALIQQLHSGGGSVADTDVQAVITDLQNAASALSAAKPTP